MHAGQASPPPEGLVMGVTTLVVRVLAISSPSLPLSLSLQSFKTYASYENLGGPSPAGHALLV